MSYWGVGDGFRRDSTNGRPPLRRWPRRRPAHGQSTSNAQPARIQPLKRPLNLTALCVLGLFVLAAFYTFYFARAFLLPVTLAWIFCLLLKPLVGLLKRCHIPEALGAGLVLAAFLGLIIGGLVVLSEPASRWVNEAPAALEKAKQKFKSVNNPARNITQAAAEVEKMTEMKNQQSSTPKVEIKQKGLMDTLLERAKGAIFIAGETFILLYFFLAAGDLFLVRLMHILPRLKDKKRAVEMTSAISQQVSRYLGTITLINLFEGTAVGIGMALAGMPNPVLWGVMAALVNYIPYIGAMTGMVIVTIVAFLTFDSFGRSILPLIIYFSINFMDNFITPMVMGKRLVLNPVLVFLSLMFWGWIWGPVGVFLAVPILMIFKIICDHIETLRPAGEFISGERKEEKAEASALLPRET